MIDAETERAAALVRQYPIDHPPMLDRWPYADVPRRRPEWSVRTGFLLGAFIGGCIVTGLLGGLH